MKNSKIFIHVKDVSIAPKIKATLDTDPLFIVLAKHYSHVWKYEADTCGYYFYHEGMLPVHEFVSLFVKIYKRFPGMVVFEAAIL